MVKRVGPFLAIGGSVLSLTGALVNNLLLAHTDAMIVWAFSNPIFLAYFVGVDMEWWNGEHISTRALIVTYAVFTASNLWGLWHVYGNEIMAQVAGGVAWASGLI